MIQLTFQTKAELTKYQLCLFVQEPEFGPQPILFGPGARLRPLSGPFLRKNIF